MMIPEELQARWAELNARYFDSRLPPIAIVCSRRLTSSAGMFRAKHGPRAQQALTHENDRAIRLSVPLLASEPATEVIGTLAHEMIHQWQYDVLKKRVNHGADFHRMMATMNRDGMHITVKHDLDGVEAFLKYSWQCETCGHTYRRQRRTIKKKHRCGKCRGQLNEIRKPPETKTRL
jgi:predicted SprT family Zn-dependent metalloprotease